MAALGLAWAPPTLAAPPVTHSMRPAAGSESHLTAESSQVLPAWTPSATLLTVYGVDSGVAQTAGRWQVEQRASSHVLAAIGLFDHAEIGFDLPLVMYQTGSAANDKQTLEPAAIGDLRLIAKGTIFRMPSRGFGLGASLDMTMPTGVVGALAGVGGVSAMPQVLAEYRATRGIQATANFGYLIRPDSRVGDYTIGDALTYRIAGKVPFGNQSQFEAMAEMDGAIGVVDGSTHPLVLRAGLRMRMRSGILLGAFVGGAPVSTLGTPDFHTMLSLGYTPPNLLGAERAYHGSPRPTPLVMARRHERSQAIAQVERASTDSASSSPSNPDDPDADGILAVADACPTVREDLDSFEDSDGCPEWDNDRDGLRDGLDLCPGQPEVNNGYADWDGCPDARDENGQWHTTPTFVPESILPALNYIGNQVELEGKSLAELDRFSEIVRLNPWMSQIELKVYAMPAPPSSSGNRRAAHMPKPREEGLEEAVALAGKRADALRSALAKRGVDDWRVRVLEPSVRPQTETRQVVVALRGQTSGLRAVAPAPARIEEMIATAVERARREDALAAKAVADPQRHKGTPTPKLDTSGATVMGQGGKGSSPGKPQLRANPRKSSKRSNWRDRIKRRAAKRGKKGSKGARKPDKSRR